MSDDRAPSVESGSAAVPSRPCSIDGCDAPSAFRMNLAQAELFIATEQATRLAGHPMRPVA